MRNRNFFLLTIKSEQVVEMTAEFMRRKEDAEFEKAFAEAGI